ncbi:MAG: hypothetical protein HY787_14600 [Deltaproteobacteria bacterium]|nr:hypothetical protein [Deltaproteobacteria bacterium]
METNAHYKLPNPEACYVDPSEMPQLLRSKNIPNRHGVKRLVQEGFMIRQSSVQDGKAVIPPGGLIYLENGGEYFGPLNGEPCLIAGEEAFWIDQQEALLVKKDFFVPFGGRPVPLGEEGTIALSPYYFTDSYYGEKAGSLRFVFSNGHPGWDKWIMLGETGYGKSQDQVSTGYMEGEGLKTPPPLQYFGNSYSAFNSTYVVVDSFGPTGAQIKEAGAPAVVWFKVSYEPPIIADQVKVGQTVSVKDFQVKVLSCDRQAGTAGLAWLDSQGKILVEKVVGPLTLETYKIKNLLHHDIALRQNLSLDYNNFRVQLNTKYDSPLLGFGPTNLLDKNNHFVPATEAKEISTFRGDKIDLVIYTNIEKIFLRNPWEKNPEFVFQTHYL